MERPKIRFSHWYEKLRRMFGVYQPGLTARLVSVTFVPDLKVLPAEFLQYDTLYLDKTDYLYYPLPKESKYLLLVFFVREGQMLFTTIRPYNSFKRDYYFGLIGKEFEIALEEKRTRIKTNGANDTNTEPPCPPDGPAQD